MTLFERFAAAFRRHQTEASAESSSQQGREALVDLLVWTMFVDRHLALAEHEKLDQLTRDLPWRSVTSLADYFREAVARARGVIDDEAAAEAYLRDIGARLGDTSGRRLAFTASEQMMSADGKLAAEEAAHLRTISKAFELR